MQNKRQTTVNNIIWAYSERMMSQVITFAASVILARILSPESYGVIAMVMVFISVCDAMVTGGFGNALIQKKDSKGIDFDSICWLSIILSLFLYVTLFFIAPYISAFYGYEELTVIIRIMGIRLIFSAYNSVQQAYVQKKMIFKTFFWATLIGTIISAIVGIVVAIIGGGVWALVSQYLTKTVIDTVILYYLIDWKPGIRFSIKSIRELWGFGAKMLAATMTYTLKDNIRSLVIGRKFSSADLAYYNQGSRYPALLVDNVVESLGKVLFPVLSEEQNSVDNLKEYVRKTIRVSSFLLSPLIMGLLAVADTFVIALFTEKWNSAILYLRILCLVYITRSINAILQKAILAMGKSGVILFHEIVTSVLTIFFIIRSAYVYKSVEMIAWSYVIIMLVGTIIFVCFSKKYIHYKIRELLADFLPTMVLACVMAFISWLVGRSSINEWVKLFLQIIVGIMIYILGARALNIYEYRYIKEWLLRKTRKVVSNKK